LPPVRYRQRFPPRLVLCSEQDPDGEGAPKISKLCILTDPGECAARPRARNDARSPPDITMTSSISLSGRVTQGAVRAERIRNRHSRRGPRTEPPDSTLVSTMALAHATSALRRMPFSGQTLAIVAKRFLASSSKSRTISKRCAKRPTTTDSSRSSPTAKPSPPPRLSISTSISRTSKNGTNNSRASSVSLRCSSRNPNRSPPCCCWTSSPYWSSVSSSGPYVVK